VALRGQGVGSEQLAFLREFIRTHPTMQFFGIAEPGATRRGAFFLFGIVTRKYNYSPADVAFDL
jgi:hypothetical protein